MVGVLAWVAAGIGGVVAAGAAAGGAFLANFDANSWKGTVAEQVSAALGREVVIEGPLEVDWGLTPHINVKGIRVRNAPWSDEPYILSVDEADGSIRLLDLVRGRINIPHLDMLNPRVVLEHNKEGEANWLYRDRPRNEAAKEVAEEATVPDDRTEVPLIGRLTAREGVVLYRDPRYGIRLENRLTTATGEGGEGRERIHLEGQGQFGERPFKLILDGGSLEQLRLGREPYPVRAEAHIGQTRAIVDGAIDDPIQMRGPVLGVELQGPGLHDLFPIFGIPAPPTPDYHLKGKVTRQEAVWTVNELAVRFGRSEFAGGVSLDTGQPKTTVTGELVATTLDLADLSGFIGARLEEKADKTKRLLPEGRLPVEQLHAANVDLRLRSEKILPGGLPVDRFAAHFKLRDGLLQVDPIEAGVMKGTVRGGVTVDGRQSTTTAKADLRIRGLPLAALLSGSQDGTGGSKSPPQDVQGTISGRIQLGGPGRSVAEVAGRADGQIALILDGGRIGSATVRGLIGDTAAKALGIVANQDIPVQLRCIVADFEVARGIAERRILVVDTTEVVVHGEGGLNLRNETLSMRIQARPKEPNLAVSRTPVTISGPIADPQFGIEAGELAARGAAAVALSVLLTPLAAVIPFIDPGLEPDSPCGQLIQQSGATR